MASGEETIHRGDEILGRNGPGAGVQAVGIVYHTPGCTHGVRITRKAGENQLVDAEVREFGIGIAKRFA